MQLTTYRNETWAKFDLKQTWLYTPTLHDHQRCLITKRQQAHQLRIMIVRLSVASLSECFVISNTRKDGKSGKDQQRAHYKLTFKPTGRLWGQVRSIVYIMTVNNVVKHHRVEGTCKLIRMEYLYVQDAHGSDAHRAVWMHLVSTLRTSVIYCVEVLLFMFEPAYIKKKTFQWL
jgi:hypothetical protein